MSELGSDKFALPTAGFSVTTEIELKNIPGALAKLVNYLAENGASQM